MLPIHRKIKEGASEEDILYDLIVETSELIMARRDCLRKRMKQSELDKDTIKEAVDVLLTAHGYLYSIAKDPESCIRAVVADNIRRGLYDEDTVRDLHTYCGGLVKSLSNILEELR